uniref:Proteolipid protein 2 n=1 Tax=Canis lupus familiaris TaxID=9615 RepID=A0A8C0NRT0_CANLF
ASKARRPRRWGAPGAPRQAGSILGGRGEGASGAAATWPGPLRPRPLLLREVIHSLLRPGGPLPGQTAGKTAGCAASPNPRASACTNFSRTRKGILLFAEIILCLVILICFSASTPGYSSLSVVEMILAAIFFVIYMCDLHTKIQIINWPWSDFFRTLIAAILYLITSIVVLVEGGNHSKIIAGVLGLIATSLFGYDAYITFPLRQQRHTAAPTDPADGPV